MSMMSTSAASSHLNTSGLLCSIDESYKYVFLPLCYSITFLLSLTLNSVVLMRSCRRPRSQRWNTSLIYMVNLATTDLMYGLSLPLLVASYILKDRWLFGDFTCRLVRFLFYFNLYCSIFFLTCISIHRYLGICHPMRTITLESRRVVRGTCATVWAVVFILTSPIFRFAQTGFVPQGTLDATGLHDFWDNKTVPGKGYINCWDDAIDREFADYVPYGIILHVLGFFLPFLVIAWCYTQVIRTIFQTMRSSQSPSLEGEDGPVRGEASEEGKDRDRTSVSISGSQYSHYIRRRRKSIKTILTITLLFALCFLPFHVTRTVFLLLRRGGLEGRGGMKGCSAIKTVSICYKVTRPLASCNAWLNALLYFLTGDKSASCCGHVKPFVRRNRRSESLWWPLKILKKDGTGEDDVEAENVEIHVENESKSSRVV
ncbi:P2Y purinoceptor 3 [Neosynchiropus ocellatus]